MTPYLLKSVIYFQVPVDIQPSAPVTVSLTNSNTPPLKLVSSPLLQGIVYHSLNLSNPVLAVQLTAKPLQSEGITIFVDIGRKPTATSHRWNFTLPKMVNDSIGDNFTVTDNAYSITLPAKVIKDALADLVNSNSSANASSTGIAMIAS